MTKLTYRALGVTIALTVVAAGLTLTAGSGVAQQGAAPVRIVGPLPVPVTSNEPVPQPFQTGTTFVVMSGGAAVSDLVTVPEGKLLIVEHISASVNMTEEQGISGIGIFTEGRFDSVDALDCRPVGASANGLNHFYSCSSQTRYYVAAGDTLQFFVGAADFGDGFFRAFVSGHYVDSAGAVASVESSVGLTVSGQLPTVPRK